MQQLYVAAAQKTKRRKTGAAAEAEEDPQLEPEPVPCFLSCRGRNIASESEARGSFLALYLLQSMLLYLLAGWPWSPGRYISDLPPFCLS